MKAIPSGPVVKYFSIGSVLKRNQGMPVTATQMKAFESGSSEVRIFAGGATYVDTDQANVPPRSLHSGPAIIVKSRGNIGFEFWTGPFSHKNELWSYSAKHADVSIKYVYYYLESLTQQLHDLARSKSVKMPQLAVGDIDSLVVPFPDLAIQDEIVDFLDTITSLETELESELEAREKQLEHYRNELLTFDTKSSGMWASFGEVCKVATGSNIGKSDIRNKPGIYPVINSGIEPLGYFAEFNSEDDPIGITSRGAGVGSITWCEGKYFRGGLNYSATIRDEKRLSVRFLYHWLLHSKSSLAALSTFSGIPALNKGSLERLLVPLIPLEEQNEITSILDKLEALISDPSSGLAAELRSRRNQYEYYRDKLLTFKEA